MNRKRLNLCLLVACAFLLALSAPLAALAGTAETLHVVSANFDAIFTVVGLVLSLVSPALAALWWRGRKVARELVEVIDREPAVANKEFRVRAVLLGKKAAARALEKIT